MALVVFLFLVYVFSRWFIDEGWIVFLTWVAAWGLGFTLLISLFYLLDLFLKGG